MPGKHAMPNEIQRTVKCGLPAHGGQQGIGFFTFADLFKRLPGNWFDVGDIGRFRVGHDGSRVAVDQDGAITLCLQGLAGLCTGIVELASLSNDDWPGTDNENAGNICTLGHGANYLLAAMRSVKRWK